MPTNLPTAPNAFVGRESDVEELLGLLGAARLVTLCGTGGIGKTRLALRVASEAVETFSDGVWLVELGDLESGEGLDDRVAFALGVPVEELSGALTGGHQLLVFDNCEHLVDSCAELCTRLLASCPDLRVLATSREPLRVAGETVWRVPPLSLLAEKPVGSDAVRLFVQRSEAATGEQQWTAADDEAVASLCAELEGIPLAIELAAAMTRVLSVEQIRSRLSDRFKLLTSGSRSAPVRQRTLLATVEWSYRMLGGPAQALLRRLTVFRGGWTLWMAESVCPGDGLEPDEVLTTMAELVDKSLVIADARFGGEIRYRMLDTIRDYAGQRLREEGGQAEAELRQRHLECMRAAAARGAVLLTTATKDNWAETLRFFHAIDAVQPNFYAAMAHALTTGQVEQVLHITADLQWALVGGGRFDEATRYIDRALEVAADVPKGVIGQATGVRALLCFYGGDLEGMIGHAGRGLELSRADGNLPGEITCTLLLLLASWEGLTFDGAAELADRYGDTYFKAFVVYGRALVAQLNGQLREAQRQYEAMLEVLRESTEWGSAQAVIGLAQLAHARGDLGGAVHHYEHAQRLLHALDYRGDRIRCLTGLGKIAIELGDFDSARSRLAESLSLSTGLGQRAAAVELISAVLF
ncbi:MAG: hypothetical protein HOY71_36490, partial [Nonomuraea sp.]|nr:hypothetical protein [Nonomuraea sp.]